MRFEIGQGRLLTQARGARDVRALQWSMDSDSESSSDEERCCQHPFYQTIPSIVDAFPTVEFDLTQFDSLDDQCNSSTPSEEEFIHVSRGRRSCQKAVHSVSTSGHSNRYAPLMAVEVREVSEGGF